MANKKGATEAKTVAPFHMQRLRRWLPKRLCPQESLISLFINFITIAPLIPQRRVWQRSDKGRASFPSLIFPSLILSIMPENHVSSTPSIVPLPVPLLISFLHFRYIMHCIVEKWTSPLMLQPFCRFDKKMIHVGSQILR